MCQKIHQALDERVRPSSIKASAAGRGRSKPSRRSRLQRVDNGDDDDDQPELVDTSDSEDEDDNAALDRWLDSGKPCEVTDWHVDEPWESAPARFTVLWAAESEGPIETRFASTRLDRIDLADRELLAGAVGTFAPPPWLPQEKGTARHALTRDDAMYICADSLRDVDGMERRDAVAAAGEGYGAPRAHAR